MMELVMTTGAVRLGKLHSQTTKHPMVLQAGCPSCHPTNSVSVHAHTHTVLTAIFPGESELAGCPLNSPSPFIPGLRILLGQA